MRGPRADLSKQPERGVALITVVVVLLALVVIATPFSISMRNFSESTTDFLDRARCRKESEALRNLAFETLQDTHPASDLETPLFDEPSEWSVNLQEKALPFDYSNPRGKIWSARAEDLQGRINVNNASLFLFANLLDQRTRLAEDMKEGSLSLKVSDTSEFPEEGHLWIEGEALAYFEKNDRSFEDVDRNVEDRGQEQSLLESSLPSLHLGGTEVFPLRAFYLATYCYRYDPGRFSAFPSREALRNLAIFSETSLTHLEYARFADRITVHAPGPGGRRFVNPQRLLGFGSGANRNVIEVENGRYLGPGSIVRIQCGEELYYSLVIRSEPLGERSWALLLQEKAPFPPDRYSTGIVDCLARSPVNINGASPEVLVALLRGLALTPRGKAWFDSLEGSPVLPSEEETEEGGVLDFLGLTREDEALPGSMGGRPISESLAVKIAAALADRPIKNMADLDQRLAQLAASGAAMFSDEQHQAVLLNALNANDAFVQGGTAPFCFASGGAFQVETAVSDNYPMSGREKARHFTRDVVRVAPAGSLLTVYASQQDFEEARRLSREGRHYMTLPENLTPPDVGNLPPSLARSYYFNGRQPSAKLEEGALVLAPVREEGPDILHFDETDQPYFDGEQLYFDRPGEDPGDAPWLYPRADGFQTGERVLFCRPEEAPLSLVGDPELGEIEERLWPFSVEMWYRFDEVGEEHYLFDCGLEGEEVSNRVYLYHDGKDLVFRVADVSLPTATPGSAEPVEHAEIRFGFEDLPLEQGVFYHIACQAVGTRPSDLCLFVDGISRGRRAFQTRLTTPLSELDDQSTAIYTKKSSRTIQVEDATSFPSRGVLRVGRELVEYTSRSDQEFYIEPEDNDPFGGRAVRGGLEDIDPNDEEFGQEATNDHPESETIELYGYTCTLRSQRIPQGDRVLGENMGRFWVARVSNGDSSLATNEILVKAPEGVSGGMFDYLVGEGFYTDDSTTSLPLAEMNSDSFGEEGMEAFSSTGGYAVIFSEFPTKPIVTFSNKDGGAETWTYGRENSDRNRPVTPNGYLINRFSVVRYRSFNDGKLEGLQWWNPGDTGGGFPPHRPRNFMQITEQDETAGIAKHIYDFTKRRCFVTRYDKSFETGNVEFPRIFIMPISISLSTGDRPDLFEDYFTQSEFEPEQGYLPELIQIGTEFQEDEETEWIRYDSIEQDIFCRMNLNDAQVQGLWDFLSPMKMIDTEGATQVDDEDVSNALNVRLDFRGQHGTRAGKHPQERSLALPVFAASATGISRPGRNDAITLVHYDPESDFEEDPEGVVINYVNCYGGQPQPYSDRHLPGPVALIGLKSAVIGRFNSRVIDEKDLLKRLMKQALVGEDAEGLVAEAVSAAMSFESRDFTRIVKFPSGELPSLAPDTFTLGGNILGNPSPGSGCLDEVRFRRLNTPHAKLPKTTRFVLAREMEEGEENLLFLYPDKVRLNRRTLKDDLIEAFQILESLPEDAGFLLVGDEIIAYTDVDWEDGILTLAPDGRGMLGTRPGHHTANEPVLLLNFPQVTALRQTLRRDDSVLVLEDTQGFPFEGAVLIGEEVVGYTRREEDLLTMPEGNAAGFRSADGLLRGRFGTDKDQHSAGTLVYRLPARTLDLYMPGAEAPEEARFPISLDGPGALFTRVTWVEDLQGPGADIVVKARVGGRGAWTDDPENSRDLFLFEDPENQSRSNALLRQGDRLDLRIYTRYGPGAFDPFDFAANAWKYRPRLTTLAVEYLQPTRILRHEEW